MLICACDVFKKSRLQANLRNMPAALLEGDGNEQQAMLDTFVLADVPGRVPHGN